MGRRRSWNTNEKPNNRIELNPDNYFARVLQSFWIPQMGDDILSSGVAGQFPEKSPDLVAGENLINNYYPTGRDWKVGVENGRILSRSDYVFGLINPAGGSIVFTDDEPYTIISRTFAPSSEAKILVIASFDSAYIWNRRGVYFRFNNGTTSYNASSATASTGIVTSCASLDGGGAGAGLLTTHQFETNETATVGSVNGGASFETLGSADQSDVNTYEFWAVFKTNLPVPLMRAFCTDPFQVVRSIDRQRKYAPASAPAPSGVIMNQFQSSNMGADLYNGTIL